MTKQPDFLSWPDSLAIVEMYKDGVGAWAIYHEHNPYRHSYPQIRAMLQHMGIWRNQSEAQTLRHKRNKVEEKRDSSERPAPTVDPWVRAELDAIAHAPSPGLRGFKAMFAVDTQSGKVLLNRVDEALEPYDRFECRRYESEYWWRIMTEVAKP